MKIPALRVLAPLLASAALACSCSAGPAALPGPSVAPGPPSATTGAAPQTPTAKPTPTAAAPEPAAGKVKVRKKRPRYCTDLARALAASKGSSPAIERIRARRKHMEQGAKHSTGDVSAAFSGIAAVLRDPLNPVLEEKARVALRKGGPKVVATCGVGLLPK